MAEIPFEQLLIALESTRGTAVNPPTHALAMRGRLSPKQERYRPTDGDGTLAEYRRSKSMRRWSEWEGDSALDTLTLPLLAAMSLRGGISPTTPSGGTNARLWTHAPVLTTDDLKSGTLYWGDPNIQMLQAPYAMLDELTIAWDSSGSDGATQAVKGHGQFPSKTAPSSTPALLAAPLIVPAETQLWLDSSSAIGTTEILARVVSGQITIPTGVTYKWLNRAPGTHLSYNATGRSKRHASLQITFELLDMAQYDLFADSDGDTVVKARVRLNGPVIESTLRHYVEFDVYGTFDNPDWGEHAGSNRTLSLTILSERDATAGYDYALKIQNNRSTL